jgi:hypothetical protein
MLGGTGRLSPTCQHRQNHVAAGDARLQRLGAGGLDRGQAMIEHRAQHLDELAVAVGVMVQFARTWVSAAGRSQSLNGAPLRKAPGFFISTGR